MEAKRGLNDAAVAAFGEALALYRSTGTTRGVAHALLRVGRVVKGTDPASARRDLEDAAALYDQLEMDDWATMARKEARMLNQ
jgi:hypothetical protein